MREKVNQVRYKICVTLNLDRDNRDVIHNGRILGCHLGFYRGKRIFYFHLYARNLVGMHFLCLKWKFKLCDKKPLVAVGTTLCYSLFSFTRNSENLVFEGSKMALMTSRYLRHHI